MINNLLRLISTHPDPLHATSQWKRKACESFLCPYCNMIDRSYFPRPIDVIVRYMPSGIFDAVSFAGVCLYHSDFILQIKNYLDNFILGKCFDTSGNLIPEYITCYSNKYIVIRGIQGSEYEVCPECGTVSPLPGNYPHYIPRFYLTDARIYQTSDCDMFLDEGLVKELDFSPWPDAELEPIAIRDEPIDGQVLPIDPGYVKPPDPDSASAAELDSENMTE